MKVLLIILGILVVIGAALLLISEWERRHPMVVNYEVKSRKLPVAFSGMKILFLTDFHCQNYRGQKESLYKMIRETEPDLILLGGDMINAKHSTCDFSEFEALLSHLPENVPAYFAKGNHERRLFSDSRYVSYKDEFLDLLERYHVKLISGDSVTISRGDEKITLSSLELSKRYYEDGTKKDLLKEDLETGLVKTDHFHICLVHTPLYREELAKQGVDLTLSGHFHGGTIYLGERLGGLMTPQYQFFSKDCKGMKTYGEKAGIVSAGLGTHSINVRLNDRPEIILVTLEKEYAD